MFTQCWTWQSNLYCQSLHSSDEDDPSIVDRGGMCACVCVMFFVVACTVNDTFNARYGALYLSDDMLYDT
jgi:hypothetical protein